MAFVHVGRRGSGRATRLTRSTAREARPRRRGGDLVRSGAPDMSGISRQSEKPRGIPDTCAPNVCDMNQKKIVAVLIFDGSCPIVICRSVAVTPVRNAAVVDMFA